MNRLHLPRRTTIKAPIRWRLIALIVTAALLIPQATLAYELAPSGKFTHAAIDDGTISICYGLTTTEQIYSSRSQLALYFQKTWGTNLQGGYGNVTFSSNGLCNNDGSNIQIKWNRSWACTGDVTLGQVQTFIWDWDQVTIYLNANCNIDGRWDWSADWPDGSSGNNTGAGKWSIQRVAAHEVGHALGIQRSSNLDSIMAEADDNCPIMGSSQGLDRDDSNAMKDEYSEYPFAHGIGNAPDPAPCWG